MGKYLKIFLVIVLVADVTVLNIFLYLLWNKKSVGTLVQNNNCPSDCNQLIDKKISSLVTPTLAVVITKVPAAKTRSIQYIPISGSGSTLENKWVDLSGTEFYISTNDYPNLIGAYFEANMKLINGNGLAYLRLFDVTAGIEVWGSEVSTNSQSFTSVSSGKMTIRDGTHLYRVQAKSLTADTTVFNSGRVKIILEN